MQEWMLPPQREIAESHPLSGIKAFSRSSLSDWLSLKAMDSQLCV